MVVSDKQREYNKKYYQLYKEKHVAECAKYYQANKERIAIYKKIYYEKNRDRLRIYQLNYYHNNKYPEDKVYFLKKSEIKSDDIVNEVT